MEYIFEVNIATDGDFCFPYTPRDMDFDNYERYSLDKSYNNIAAAVGDITDICAFLKEQLCTSRNYVRKDFNKMIDDFVRRVYEAEDVANTYINEYLSGNYDGTELIFRIQPHKYPLNLRVTDEEYELIRKNEKLVTIEQVKEAVLNLFK